MTYLIIVLVVILCGGTVYGRRVLAKASVDDVTVTKLPPDEVLEIARKKLKGLNVLAGVERNGNSVSRSWEREIAKTTSTATLTITADVEATSGSDRRSTVVRGEISNMSYPRVAFVMPLPQGPLSALKRRKAIMRAVKRAELRLGAAPQSALPDTVTQTSATTPELHV